MVFPIKINAIEFYQQILLAVDCRLYFGRLHNSIIKVILFVNIHSVCCYNLYIKINSNRNVFSEV